MAGARPAHEVAMVGSVARGSFFNKCVLVPAALAISWATPWAIPPLLVLGGAFLCYEGAEKILHRLRHGGDAGHPPTRDGPAEEGCHDPETHERQRVAAAIRTDFILSAEIIVITLGVVAGRPLVVQLAMLSAISVAMTIGVYGMVAAIVKLDDLGAMLAGRANPLAQGVGRSILAVAPWMMRGLSAAGTAAMFLVGGGIIAHALPAVHAFLHDLAPDGWLTLLAFAADAAVGLLTGFLVLGVLKVLPASASRA